MRITDMLIPSKSVYFEPQDTSHFYAAQGGLFLVDPGRLHDLMGDRVLGSDLIKTLTRKSYPHEAYRQGAIVPALGVDQTHFTVTLRSSETVNAPLPLSHMLFSTGFVLGTETGDLLLCNTDRLQHWSPGELPPGKEEHPLESFERRLHVSPGWYGVTVVTGLRETIPGRYEDPNQWHGAAGEEWICAFMLDPKPIQPAFIADLNLPLSA